MLTDQKPLMRVLRRIHTFSSSSPSNSSSSQSSSSSWIHLRSILLVVASSSSSSSSTSSLTSSQVSTTRGNLRSPWSRRRRKHALLPKQWKSLFTSEGKLCDGAVKFLKKARSGGVDPSIRAEVWPFLLGVYDLHSSKEERDYVRSEKRREYENLRRKCKRSLKCKNISFRVKEPAGGSSISDSEDTSQVLDSQTLEDVSRVKRSCLTENNCATAADPDCCNQTFLGSDPALEAHSEKSTLIYEDGSASDLESTGSDYSEESVNMEPFISTEGEDEIECNVPTQESTSTSETESKSKSLREEDFSTWQKIIRVDAIRDNAEWIMYSPSLASVSENKARRFADSVGLKEYDHLEPCRIFHAARLVSILEAYAVYDPEIGYCQGMSDLLSPIAAVMEEDDEAFWCFVGFMKKARHNFRLDEMGIRRQLEIISKIIKCKDSHLYRHLEKLQAEDCIFVYRMVVVLFRRELNLEQTLCLWEVMWADQAAIRAGIARSAWGKMRLRAPPTDDLLLYAIAACVLQRRKLIIEKYSSVDEIMKECNSMAKQLDVWKLLDDAHDLVVTLHDKI